MQLCLNKQIYSTILGHYTSTVFEIVFLYIPDVQLSPFQFALHVPLELNTVHYELKSRQPNELFHSMMITDIIY